MSTRISSLALLPLLVGCGSASTEPAADEPKAEAVFCALGGSQDFAQDCVLQRTDEVGRPAFVVRHPDGKFRRLIASADGQSLLAADGADQSQSARKANAEGERWEVILEDDRYVIPVKANAQQR